MRLTNALCHDKKHCFKSLIKLPKEKYLVKRYLVRQSHNLTTKKKKNFLDFVIVHLPHISKYFPQNSGTFIIIIFAIWFMNYIEALSESLIQFTSRLHSSSEQLFDNWRAPSNNIVITFTKFLGSQEICDKILYK